MAKYLYRFFWDCGRQGELEGLFVEDEKVLRASFGTRLYFGEVLGKHSDIYGTFEEEDVEKMELSSETVTEVSKILGVTWSGYNPMNYLSEE